MGSMNSINETIARRPAARHPFATALGALALTGSVLLGACDGDNLFSGDTGVIQQGPPLVVSIDAPTEIREGGTLDVRIKALAPRGMDELTVRYRRALTDQKQFTFEGRTDTATVDVTIFVPAEAADSVLVIEAFVSDLAGRVSDVFSDTVRIIDSSSPTVSATLTPTTASMGDTVVISVAASDRFGLSALGYAIVTADGDTIRGGPSFSAVTGTQRDTTFTVVLPDSLQPATLSVVGLAVNSAQLRGVSSPLALRVVDQRPPTVSILRPQQDDSHPLTDSLLVRVHAADSGGIASIRMYGEAIRRDSLQNTEVVQRFLPKVIPLPQAATDMPRDTIVIRYLLPTNVGVSERVNIIAEVTDASGNASADTISIVDGPGVAITSPAEGTVVGLNRSLLVDINAVDRNVGLDSMHLVVEGVVQRVIPIRGLAARAELDTTLSINTGGSQGPLRLTARVWNRDRVMGASQQTTLQVQSGASTDAIAPLVSRQVISSNRMELGDSVAVTVRATDGVGSGIVRMGIVLTASADTLSAQESFYRTTQTFTLPLSGTPEQTFYVSLGEKFSETQMRFPRTFDLQVHAFAVDADGNCGASVTENLTSLACDTVVAGGVRYHPAADGAPVAVEITATGGRSISIPGGGRIGDVVIDSATRRVYLSNIQNNRVEMFHMGPDTFYTTGSTTGRGLVGAAPWGMFINNRGDSLFVANSGGTNVSVMNINPSDPRYGMEDLARRILTPEITLQNVSWTRTDGSLIRYNAGAVTGFSDRPQYIAQHASGTVVYSTWPTSAAPRGTLRYVETSALTGRPVVKLLTSGSSNAADVIGLTNVDSVKVIRPGPAHDDSVRVFDRHPVTNVPLDVTALDLGVAIDSLIRLGSDVQFATGGWPNDFLQDTTYVAASGDRSTIAFGEGGTGTTPGRIFLCCSLDGVNVGLTSAPVHIEDLIDNAAETIFGLSLNWTGTYGVARGSQSAYFFTANEALTTPLRLQGEFRSGIAGGRGGIAMHPGLRDVLAGDIDRRLAFVATGNSSIKIIDSVHFYERGEIALRDNVVGPVRAVFPSAAQAGEFPSNHPNHVVMVLVAVTAGDNVVIINVRRKDILQ